MTQSKMVFDKAIFHLSFLPSAKSLTFGITDASTILHSLNRGFDFVEIAHARQIGSKFPLHSLTRDFHLGRKARKRALCDTVTL